MIELRDVTKVFGRESEVRALDGVHLSVREGDYLSIMGRSGSGKSTLLNVIGMLDSPSSGAYLWDGIDTMRLSERAKDKKRAEAIGFVFQQFRLFSRRSALENVMAAYSFLPAPPNDGSDLARAMLKQLGLDRIVDKPARLLSGGEQQRVAIARALVKEPGMLLCDEPSGNLDTSSAADVIAAIEAGLDEGTAVVVVTHDDGLAKRAKRRMRMVDGRIESI